MAVVSKKLSAKRKLELEERAQWAVDDHFGEDELIRPEIIATAEGIAYKLDDYKNEFKGVLEYADSEFRIYLHAARGENLRNTQVRFSFAHELGHYFIDEHRWELMSAGFLPHVSTDPLIAESIFEKEAEYFASCMLMPRGSFLRFVKDIPFSYELILDICRRFRVSLTAALLRYIVLGDVPITVVFALADGHYLYHAKSRNFPFYSLNLDEGGFIPSQSKAGGYCYHNDSNFKVFRVIPAATWFKRETDADANMNFTEACFLQPKMGRIVSVIWEVKLK